MPGILELIRKRWPEVLLIVGIQVAGVMLAMEVMKTIDVGREGGEVSDTLLFFTTMGSTVFLIIWQMLSLGFQATALHVGAQPQPPGWLFRIGRYYFWRIFWFGLLLTFAISLLVELLMALVASQFYQDATTVEELPGWLPVICLLAISLLFIKPLLLVPAIVVAKDVRVMESVKRLRDFSLLHAHNLLLLILVYFVINGLPAYLMSFMAEGPLKEILTAGHAVVVAAATFVLTLAVLRFVVGDQPPVQMEEGKQSSEQESAFE